MKTKNIIFSSIRTGNHFILRSISKSLGIPYAIFIQYERTLEEIKNTDKYVISMHLNKSEVPPLEKFGTNVNFMTIYRNPLDHALSVLRMTKNKIDPNSDEFIKWLAGDEFSHYRQVILDWQKDLFVINYDILNSSDSILKNNHINDIKLNLQCQDFILEKIEDTRKEHGIFGAPVGISGRWRNIITKDTWEKCAHTLTKEDINEFWNNPDLDLKKEDGSKTFFDDYEKAMQ